MRKKDETLLCVSDTVENIQINHSAEQLTREGTILRDMLALNF